MRLHRQQGLTLSGLIFGCALLGTVALIGMKLFPLYNEKMKVDNAMSHLVSQQGSRIATKEDVVRALLRDFEVSDVDRFDRSNLSRIIEMENVKNSRDKQVRLRYEVRGPLFGELDVVLKYDRTVIVPAGGVD